MAERLAFAGFGGKAYRERLQRQLVNAGKLPDVNPKIPRRACQSPASCDESNSPKQSTDTELDVDEDLESALACEETGTEDSEIVEVLRMLSTGQRAIPNGLRGLFKT